MTEYILFVGIVLYFLCYSVKVAKESLFIKSIKKYYYYIKKLNLETTFVNQLWNCLLILDTVFSIDSTKNRANFHSIYKKIKEFSLIAKLFLVFLFLILLIYCLIVILFILITKFMIVVLQYIIEYEEKNGLGILRYAVFPFLIAVVFISYIVKINSLSPSLSLILQFYESIIKLSGLLWIPVIMTSVIYIVPLIIKKFESSILGNKLLHYLHIWTQLFLITTYFILIIGGYFTLLDTLGNAGEEQLIDSYTVIPLFIAGCQIFSNILINFISKIKIGSEA